MEKIGLSHFMGIMGGIGIGLIIGGIIGYTSKGKSLKAEQQKREWAQQISKEEKQNPMN